MASLEPHPQLGCTQQHNDSLSLNQVQRVAATLGTPAPTTGEDLPALWHWAFFQTPCLTAELGLDGHPAQGPFAPPTSQHSRMWAGGRIEFFEALRVGISATRTSTLIRLEEKMGSQGPLQFVTLRHEYHQQGRLAVCEEQDLVYRAPATPKLRSQQAIPTGEWHETITPDPRLLFRYSAITFNSHRIHYDWPYATQIEGYPGLVVHGPLIATLMLGAFCRAHPKAQLHRFTYRGLRPLISPEPFEVAGCLQSSGHAQLWAGSHGDLAHQGQVEFTEKLL